MNHDRHHDTGQDPRITALLRREAEQRAASMDEERLFRRAMASLPARPQPVVAWWRLRPLAAAALAALALALLVSVINVAGLLGPATPEASNLAKVENIESFDSMAMVTAGNRVEPTVIWVFEQ